MPHRYGLDAAADAYAATAAELAAGPLTTHAGAVDAAARFPRESVRALADAGFFGLCVAAAHGGRAQGPRTFAAVTETLAGACASTAMIYVMHVTAARGIEASATLADRDALLDDIAAGRHLSTLALSEAGSRSQFWAPVSRLEPRDGGYAVSATKSWVTAASEADSYVASAQAPSAATPLETALYLVRRGAEGVRVTAGFDGLGLRGNDSAPVLIERLRLAAGDLLCAPGDGGKLVMSAVLPWFALGTAAMANGLCQATVAATAGHLTGQGFQHTGTRLRDLPTLRARLAEMAVRSEQSRALLAVALDAVERGSEDAPLLVLQARLAALQAATDVTDLGMKACGGAAFSKHLPLERLFRDARAGWVMAPTVDHLHDFIGRALTGLPLFE